MKQLSYCNDALIGMKKMGNFFVQAECPLSHAFNSFLMKILKSSQKFILPEGGKIKPNVSIAETSLFKMPFSSIALVYDTLKESEITDLYCDARIIIAFEHTLLPKEFCDLADSDIGVFVWQLEYSKKRGWAISPWGTFLHCPIQYERNGDSDDKPLDTILVQDCLHFEYASFVEKHKLKPNNTTLLEQSTKQTINANFTLINFVCALNCSNTHVEKIKAPKQYSWIKKPKYAFEHHCLKIDCSFEEKESTSADGNSGGTHASPREHVRRGHIRRLSSGKTVWINDTVVNAGIGGFVTKDYVIQ